MPLRNPSTVRPRHARLSVEALEDRTALSTTPAPTLDLSGLLTAAAIPNDSRFGEQWGLRNIGQVGGRAGADIDAAKAWDVTTGSTRMVVSVNDTGIDYTHQDLYLNIWLNQKEIPAARRGKLIDTDGDSLITFRDLADKRNQGAGKITDLNGNGRIDGGDLLRPMIKDASGRDTDHGGWADRVSNDGDRFVDDLIGWNFSTNTNDPMDNFGHGTHVAGTIGATGGNGAGVAGLNWKVQLMGIKFLDGSGNGNINGFIAGLNYAVAHGAKISNNSWTGAGFSDELHDAVAAAQARGHLFVAAAGNAALNNDTYPDYPGSLDLANVLTVAATDRKDQLASFSNYGAQSVDLAAPGVDVVSTTLKGGYGSNTGTSMATPHVSGTLALVWADNPGWTYDQVIRQVINTADKLPSLAGKTKTGGRVNAAAAVGAAQVSAVAPRVVAAAPHGVLPSVVSSVRVTFDRAMARTSFTAADASVVGPGGKVVAVTNIKAVDGSGGRSFDIVFGAQTTVGTYTLKVGPNVTDPAGNRMAAYQTTFQVRAATPAPVGAKIVSAVPHGVLPSVVSSVRVTFDRAMARTSFTAADASVVGPGGKVVAVTNIKAVDGSGGRSFDIVFGAQTTVGTYTLKVGPNVTDAKGVRMTAYQTTFQVAAAPVVGPKIVSAAPRGAAATVVSSVRVTFDRAVALSSFTAIDASVVGPGGRVVAISGVKVVAGSGDRVFDITFAAQTAIGTYTLKVGPNVTDAKGVRMTAYQTTFSIKAAVTHTTGTKTYTATTPVSVPKGGRGVSLLTVNDTFTLADVNVKVNVSHAHVGDLHIYLQAPDGTVVLLFNRMGLGSANLTNTVFDDSAATIIGLGYGPFTGSFQPIVPLASLNGKSVKGAWKLWVEDRGGHAAGTLLNWSITARPRA